MDQRERIGDPIEALRAALEYWQSRIWTALPCVVHAYPAASGLGPQLIDVQPCVNGRLLQQINGISGFVPTLMPIITDVPIAWQGGGGVTATFPIKAGDECLVVFSARCIDAWLQNGFLPPNGSTPNPAMTPPDARMTNLSDGFAFVGVRSFPRSFTPDMVDACLITDDQQTFVKLSPTGKTVSIQANGGITLSTTGNITLTAGGQIIANGVTISPASLITTPNDISIGPYTVKAHYHTSGTNAQGNTGTMVPGT